MERTSLNNRWFNTKNLLVLVLGALVMYLVATLLLETRVEKIETNTRDLIAEQQALLGVIAEATARNGADLVTESVVKDCNLNERNSFDSLLNRLDAGLTRAELIELERLFGRCGSFYSERKAIMVSRLVREIEIYENYVDQLSVILDENVSDRFSVDTWKELADKEKKQSELFSQLVSNQDEIITTLLNGSTVNSEEIQDILHEVDETQQTLTVTNAQASKIRSSLIPL